MPIRWISIVTVMLVSGMPCRAQSELDFYKGRNIFLQIGGDVGGGHDVLGRIVARFLGKHIPGNPNIVVEDVPGGGGLALANQFANTTPHDGSVLGLMTNSIVSAPLLNTDIARFDARKFNFLGSVSKDSEVLVVWRNAPIRAPEDLFTRELIVGAGGPGSAAYQYPLVANAALGTKFKLVKGYGGGGDTMLAMQRGEIQGDAAMPWADVRTKYRHLIESKDLMIIAQYGFEKAGDLLQYPLFPTGSTEQQHQLFELIYTGAEIGSPFLVPPEVPSDRLQALRNAFHETMSDPAFLAEMHDSRLNVDPVSWQRIGSEASQLSRIPQSILEQMRRLVGEGN